MTIDVGHELERTRKAKANGNPEPPPRPQMVNELHEFLHGLYLNGKPHRFRPTNPDVPWTRRDHLLFLDRLWKVARHYGYRIQSRRPASDGWFYIQVTAKPSVNHPVDPANLNGDQEWETLTEPNGELCCLDLVCLCRPLPPTRPTASL